jgi:hypothetical protein
MNVNKCAIQEIVHHAYRKLRFHAAVDEPPSRRCASSGTMISLYVQEFAMQISTVDDMNVANVVALENAKLLSVLLLGRSCDRSILLILLHLSLTLRQNTFALVSVAVY